MYMYMFVFRALTFCSKEFPDTDFHVPYFHISGALTDIDFAMACAGILTRVGASREYGWVLPDGETKTLFVHSKQCNNASKLKAGDHVTFDMSWNDKKLTCDINNCTIIGVESGENKGAENLSTGTRVEAKFENDRSDWGPHQRRGRRDEHWKHDKWQSIYNNEKKHDDDPNNRQRILSRYTAPPADPARSSSSQQPNKRQRIPPRYTAPQITIQIDCGHRRLSMTCRESTPIAAVRRFVAHELRTSEANVRLTFSEGAHAYAQLKDELLVRDFGAGNGSTLGCTVVSPLTFALALLDAPPFLP